MVLLIFSTTTKLEISEVKDYHYSQYLSIWFTVIIKKIKDVESLLLKFRIIVHIQKGQTNCTDPCNIQTGRCLLSKVIIYNFIKIMDDLRYSYINEVLFVYLHWVINLFTPKLVYRTPVSFGDLKI